MLANHEPAVSAVDLDAANNTIAQMKKTAKLAMLKRANEPRQLTTEQIAALVARFHVEWD